MHRSGRSSHPFRRFLLLVTGFGVAFGVARHLLRRPIPADQSSSPSFTSRPNTPARTSVATETKSATTSDAEHVDVSSTDEPRSADPDTAAEPEPEFEPEVTGATADVPAPDLESEAADAGDDTPGSEPEVAADTTQDHEPRGGERDESRGGDGDESRGGDGDDQDPEPAEEPLDMEPSRTPTGVQALPGGTCPVEHPIKARFSTGRYHLPGDGGYERVVADCCYQTVEQAEADGFTHSRW